MKCLNIYNHKSIDNEIYYADECIYCNIRNYSIMNHDGISWIVVGYTWDKEQCISDEEKIIKDIIE